MENVKVAAKPARRVKKSKEAVSSSLMGPLLRATKGAKAVDDAAVQNDEESVGKSAHKREAMSLRSDTELSLREVGQPSAAGASTAEATVIIIRAGPGNPADAHFYTKACLEDSVARGVWEGVPCHIDHPTEDEDEQIPERSVESMAGYFSNARMVTIKDAETGKDVAAIQATFRPEAGNEMVLRKLRTASQYSQEHPNRSYIGFSINASGVGEPAMIDGHQYDRVDNITKVTSVDIVTRAGAGGKLLTFKESYRMAKAAVKEKSAVEASDKGVSFTEAHAKAVTESLAKSGVKATEAQITEAFTKALAPGTDSADDGDDDDNSIKVPEGQKVYEAAAIGDSMFDDDEDGDAVKGDKAKEGKKKHESGNAIDADEAASEADEEAMEASIPMAVESMTRGQLVRYAKEAISRERAAVESAAVAKREAAAAKREAATAVSEANAIKESARTAVSELKSQLRESEAKKIVEALGIPEAHRPRVLREMHRDGGKTRSGMQAIAEEYATTILGGLVGGGAILRESSVPTKLVIDCFAD